MQLSNYLISFINQVGSYGLWQIINSWTISICYFQYSVQLYLTTQLHDYCGDHILCTDCKLVTSRSNSSRWKDSYDVRNRYYKSDKYAEGGAVGIIDDTSDWSSFFILDAFFYFTDLPSLAYFLEGDFEGAFGDFYPYFYLFFDLPDFPDLTDLSD